MAITIDDLREDWTTQIAAYDRMIAFLDAEKEKDPISPGLGQPTRAWRGMLEVWRDELKNLLVLYPGSR